VPSARAIVPKNGQRKSSRMETKTASVLAASTQMSM
jgi:hypothetical protein